MARDLWDVMAIKLGGNPKSLVIHAMRAGGSPLLRTSKAWWEILRSSHGRVVDRKLNMSQNVYRPSTAPSREAFPECFRTWENLVADYETLTNIRVDPTLKAQAILLMARRTCARSHGSR